jgi:ABC-2 type transport system ATP-binding protein
VALTARVGSSAGVNAAEQAARALGELARRGITVDNFSLGQPSLDEVFLALTGHDTGADSPTDPSTGSTAGSTEGEAAA